MLLLWRSSLSDQNLTQQLHVCLTLCQFEVWLILELCHIQAGPMKSVEWTTQGQFARETGESPKIKKVTSRVWAKVGPRKPNNCSVVIILTLSLYPY